MLFCFSLVLFSPRLVLFLKEVFKESNALYNVLTLHLYCIEVFIVNASVVPFEGQKIVYNLFININT